DAFELDNLFGSTYGNASGNLRWNHIFTDRLFSNLSAIISRYDYDLDIVMEEFEWISSISNYNLKYDFKYYLNESFSLDFGAGAIYHKFDPGQIEPTSESSSINPLALDQKRALESGVYLNAEHKLGEGLTAQYGLRYSYLSRF